MVGIVVPSSCRGCGRRIAVQNAHTHIDHGAALCLGVAASAISHSSPGVWWRWQLASQAPVPRPDEQSALDVVGQPRHDLCVCVWPAQLTLSVENTQHRLLTRHAVATRLSIAKRTECIRLGVQTRVVPGTPSKQSCTSTRVDGGTRLGPTLRGV